MERDKITYDARGNGDGETVNTIIGDHCDRITDYTPIVCCHESQDPICNPGRNANAIGTNNGLENVIAVLDGDKIGKKERRGGSGLGIHTEDVGYTNTAKDVHAVCIQQNQRGEVRLISGDGKCAGALAAEPGMKQQNYIAAFNPGQSKDGGLGYEEENSPTIRANSSANDPAIAIAPMVIGRKPENGGNQIGYNESGAAYTNDTSSPQGVCKHGIVRRLLPIETERLMGFPDDWTRIPWRGKPAEECSDAPRYKACGNSMCVNCMEWIGRRIQMVEERIREEGK